MDSVDIGEESVGVLMSIQMKTRFAKSEGNLLNI